MKKIAGILMLIVLIVTPVIAQAYSLEQLYTEYDISFGFETYSAAENYLYDDLGTNEFYANCPQGYYIMTLEKKVLFWYNYVDDIICPCLNDIRCPRFISANDGSSKYRYNRMAQDTEGETIYIDYAIYLSEEY
ncbi:MAG TPA: hypothetical protein DD727_00150 [Clostridiales bacterium]|nr:hypothetical protein [Clostridiales bacterium]